MLIVFAAGLALWIGYVVGLYAAFHELSKPNPAKVAKPREDAK